MPDIREATLDDLEHILDLVEQFNNQYFDIPVDREKARATVSSLIADEKAVVLICGDSLISGVHWIDPFRDWNALVEVGWYSTDRSGIKLLAAFEKYAYDNGFDEVRMTTLEANPGVETLLYRRGYEVIETSHRLKL